MSSLRPDPEDAGAQDAPPPGRSFPLSPLQRRLWLLDRLEPENAAHNMRGAYRVDGPLDVPALERSLAEVVRRHEALRTTFPDVDGEPVQLVAATGRTRLALEDLTGRPDAEDVLRRRMTEEIRTVFDLARGPLLRVRLFRFARERHALLFVLHHIVSDGWSMGIFLDELLAAYEAFTRGEPSPFPGTPMQYAEAARLQEEHLEGGVAERQLSWWKAHLAGAPPRLDLPTDRPRPPEQTFAGALESRTLSRDLTAALETLARGSGCTPFMVVLATFAVWLQRVTGQDDVVVGSPVANRNRPELERTIGFFVNTLALRIDLSGDPTFRELLDRVRGVVLGALENQDLPFERLVGALPVERDLARTPLFQVQLLLQNAPMPTLARAGLTLERTDVPVGLARHDLTLIAWREPDGLTFRADYNADLFDAATIHRMLGQLETLLAGAVRDGDRPIARLPLLTEEERRQIEEWNETDAGDAPDATIHELFRAQVERTPDAVAVVDERERVTFAELNARANRLAHALAAVGVGAGDRVAVCLPRSANAVAAILATLKAGAAWLPLDPLDPAERLRFLVEDARPRALVTTTTIAPAWADFVPATVPVDAPDLARHPAGEPPATAEPDGVAYVIYTSGSTGRPKGVLGRHRGAVNRFRWMWDAYPFRPGEVCCQKTALGFVDSVQEMFGPLLQGVPLVAVGDETVKEPDRLVDRLARHRVTRIVLVPSLLRALLASGEDLARRLPELTFWVSSGEALPVDLCRELRARVPGATLLNLYGSSEVSADVTAYDTRHLPDDAGSVPIGRPIANTRIHILDRRLQPVPIGVAGEIHVGGAGLALGYLDRPELTAERFRPDPFGDPRGRLYRTGDLGRRLADGNIEYLGRLDAQVKIRGFRVEPGEIEAALVADGAAEEAVVTAPRDSSGDIRLVAYLVARDPDACAPERLRSRLRERLPAAMIPSTFVILDSFPRTSSGKIDRNRLPSPDPAGERRAPALDPAAAPRTATELAIADIWKEALHLRDVRLHDRFYDLGGHSLLSVAVAGAMAKRLAVPVRPRELLFHSLGQLAAECDARIRGGPGPAGLGERMIRAARRALGREE